MSAAKVLDLIQEHDVEFVDFRFVDMLGKQHHVTFPAHTIDESDVRGRQDVRRLVDLRLEGHQRVGHDPDARPGHRLPRSVQLASRS